MMKGKFSGGCFFPTVSSPPKSASTRSIPSPQATSPPLDLTRTVSITNTLTPRKRMMTQQAPPQPVSTTEPYSYTNSDPFSVEDGAGAMKPTETIVVIKDGTETAARPPQRTASRKLVEIIHDDDDDNDCVSTPSRSMRKVTSTSNFGFHDETDLDEEIPPEDLFTRLPDPDASAAAPPVFNMLEFNRNFFEHMLFPFIFPINFLIDTVPALKNKWFIPTKQNIFFFFVQLVFSVTAYMPLAIVIYFGMYEAIDDAIYAILYFAFRCLTIAGKYAYYSPSETLALRMDYPVSIENKFLLGVWIIVPSHIIDEELALAEKRMRLDLSKFTVTLRGGRRINAHTYAREVLRSVYETDPPTGFPHARTTMFVLLLAFYVGHFLARGPRNHSTYSTGEILYIVSLALSSLVVPGSISGFWNVAMIHFQRVYHTQLRLMEATCRSGHHSDDNMIDLTQNLNIFIWYRIRRVLQDFGKSYHERIGFNTFSMGILLAFLVVVLVFLILTKRATNVVIAFIMFNFLFTSLFGFGMIFFAFRANATTQQILEILATERVAQVLEITANAFECARRRSEYNDEHDENMSPTSYITQMGLQKLSGVGKQLHVVEKAIERQFVTDPVTIMKIPVSMQMVQGFAGLVVSASVMGAELLRQSST